MLGDVIKKGHHLESRQVRAWKARCGIERARKNLIELLLLPDADGEMAQMGVEYERETAQRKLEDAEHLFLCEREGDSDLTRSRAKSRAAEFSIWVVMKLHRWTPEPMHPILDVPMKWIHGEEIDIPIDSDDMPRDPVQKTSRRSHFAQLVERKIQQSTPEVEGDDDEEWWWEDDLEDTPGLDT
jgi:hypothetical protein